MKNLVPQRKKCPLHPTTLYQKHFAKGTRGQERRERRGKRVRGREGREGETERPRKEERPLPVPVEAGESLPPHPPGCLHISPKGGKRNER